MRLITTYSTPTSAETQPLRTPRRPDLSPHTIRRRLPAFSKVHKPVLIAALAAALPLLLAAPASAGPCQSSTDVFANPFDKASALHGPIGSGAVYASNSHATTLNLKRASFNSINSNNGWGVNVYKSKFGRSQQERDGPLEQRPASHPAGPQWSPQPVNQRRRNCHPRHDHQHHPRVLSMAVE